MSPRLACVALVGLALGCQPALVKGGAPTVLTPQAVMRQDVTPKAEPRLVPQEVYLQSYLALFGASTPSDVQKQARGPDGGKLFDSWADYLSALGFPDHRIDLPRATQTSALMVATFERLGEALCSRTLERDLHANPPIPVEQRLVFAFEPAPPPADLASFAGRFDVLHRTFLSYPLALAPAGRAAAFFRLYQDTVRRHQQPGAARSRFTAEEAGWVAVCLGLVRHPEHHLY